jgi:HAD superfamily hydrolase (TIGR01509 family)
LEKPVIGILWDVDGVLFDTGEIHFQSWMQALPEFGIPFGREMFPLIFGMKNEEAIPRLVGRSLAAELVDEIGNRKEEIFRQVVRGRVQLLPGVRDWLDRFSERGYPQAAASSAPRANLDAMFAETGVDSYFKAVVSAEGLPGKPDPAIFLKAASLIEIPPRRCVVFEDALSGIQAAKRAGAFCIAIATTNPLSALKEADIAVERWDELPVGAFDGFVGRENL